MKRIAAIILALLYFSTSSGAILRMHYCMGRLVSWNLATSPTKTCGDCSDKKHNNRFHQCCREDKQILRIGIDQDSPESAPQAPAIFELPLESHGFTLLSSPLAYILTPNYPSGHAPPAQAVAIFVRNCSFLK